MCGGLFTIGYQGAKLEQVVASLAAARVSVLVDTRETPTSRRVEFRQRALASALSDAGIRYMSVRALGAPKPLRAIAADDWTGFAAGYRARLALAREEIERLVPLVASERVCLLCFEADPAACHRSLLAHEIQRLLDVAAVHLRPGRPDEADDHERLMALGEIAHHQVEVAVGYLALIALPDHSLPSIRVRSRPAPEGLADFPILDLQFVGRAPFVVAIEPVAECPRDLLEFLHCARDLLSEAQALLAQVGLLTRTSLGIAARH